MTLIVDEDQPRLEFSGRWDIFGPFQIGTREATWGADPLEQDGGFRALTVDKDARFKSSLASSGEVSWSCADADVEVQGAAPKVHLTVSFPCVDWSGLQSVYGWPALQWQAWARGKLTVGAEDGIVILLNIENVLEFWLDSKPYFGGDYYAYRRAPVMVNLSSGEHVLDIRLVRDVRLFGAQSPPDLSAVITVRPNLEDLSIASRECIVPDLVNDRLTGRYASVSLTNTTSKYITVEQVDVSGFITKMVSQCSEPGGNRCSPFSIAPGQIRPLMVQIEERVHPSLTFEVHIRYKLGSEPCSGLVRTLACQLDQKCLHDLQRLTYLHPGGVVSYALLLPPSKRIRRMYSRNQRLPVTIALHGAGTDVNSEESRKAFKDWPDLPAWTLMPSGVTTWSGDDWHIWGKRDVEAALHAIPEWMEGCSWTGPGIDKDRWLVVGHSNGGQGVWYLLSTMPDKIIGAAPLSAYSSIPAYVPYQMWNQADPQKFMCIQNALRSTNHEILTRNYTNIPIYIQHGSADDNVPVFHSRRMNQLLLRDGHKGSLHYSELEGKGHWFDGVMTTPGLREFYSNVLQNPELPPLPTSFSLVLSNPAEMGPRGGLLVEHLKSPDFLGVVDVSRESTTWCLNTSNVSRLRLVRGSYTSGHPAGIHIDGQTFDLTSPVDRYKAFQLDEANVWHHDISAKTDRPRRSSRQLGPLNSLLSSRGPFQVVYEKNPHCFDTALQVARNLHQYLAADCNMLPADGGRTNATGHRITIEAGLMAGKAQSRHPLKISGRSITIEVDSASPTTIPLETGIGAIFLSPLPDDRLEAVIWGVDQAALQSASRLIPLLTGVGQPDFIITSRRCAWDGLAGVLAMGMFTDEWKASRAAFLC